ncbi:MAG TPA: hypothetical protein VF188_12440 [Longimicrobiales bacterium]
MGWFRPSRERRGPDPYLNWKIALFITGGALGAAGMLRNDGRLVAAGIAVLAVGVVLRFLRS